MKRKAVLTTIVAAMLAVCMLALAACSGSVEGKTYVFDNVKVTDYGNATDAEKKEIDEMVKMMNEQSKDSSIEFKADGKVSMKSGGYTREATYEQDGSKITVTIDGHKQECKVSGSKITMVQTDDGTEITATYKAK